MTKSMTKRMTLVIAQLLLGRLRAFSRSKETSIKELCFFYFSLGDSPFSIF
jgi:hypothetical protein